ncbi:hypothetical protein [Agrococcus sp. ProA11]|uniref:hypothetical protein n=1 Tax=Agrococcus chionoecetis TaxID=3153752 RepID=UPI0032603BDF
MALTAIVDATVDRTPDPLLHDPDGVHAAAVAAAPDPSPDLRARLGALLSDAAR